MHAGLLRHGVGCWHEQSHTFGAKAFNSFSLSPFFPLACILFHLSGSCHATCAIITFEHVHQDFTTAPTGAQPADITAAASTATNRRPFWIITVIQHVIDSTALLPLSTLFNSSLAYFFTMSCFDTKVHCMNYSFHSLFNSIFLLQAHPFFWGPTVKVSRCENPLLVCYCRNVIFVGDIHFANNQRTATVLFMYFLFRLIISSISKRFNFTTSVLWLYDQQRASSITFPYWASSVIALSTKYCCWRLSSCTSMIWYTYILHFWPLSMIWEDDEFPAIYCQ